MGRFIGLERGGGVVARNALVGALFIAVVGCTSGDDDDDANDVSDVDDDDDDDDGGTFDGWEPYEGTSLYPLFQLTPRPEQPRFTTAGVSLTDDDFTASAGGFVSVAEKLDEIAAQIALEGSTGTVELITPADRLRAERMPFRGNPSDVDVVRVDDTRVVFVPLGGSVSAPGNEVAAVVPGSGEAPRRIKVGVRPVRTAAHPAGLVFVCNQYSPYISIIDAREQTLLLRSDGSPVQLDAGYSCSDILLAPPEPGDELGDRVQIYVANQQLGVVERYGIEIVHGGFDDRPVDVVLVEPPSGPLPFPTTSIDGVGDHPRRLRLSQDGTTVFVASGLGGQVASIDVKDDFVRAFTEVGGPALDLVELQGSVFVPTTSLDRGLLSRDDRAPDAVQVGPVAVAGLDDSVHVVHPGSLYDGTRAYGFEDVRNGVVELERNLAALDYYTDDISPESSFADEQKVLAGALPIAAERDRAGNRLFLALSGSAAVQELAVSDAGARLQPVPGGAFATSARPFALAVDEDANQLLVAAWGGEVLEVFDLDDRSRVEQIDLGYANPGIADYPATNIERGELLFYSASWSNNGRKACASCHTDELSTDGLAFSIGTTAPTAVRQIRPITNLLTTDAYGWNGAIGSGGLGALELRGQTRTSCELVAYGLVEGPSSDPTTRVGDPVVADYSGGDAAACRPEPVDPATGLPANFDDIAAQIADEEDAVGRRIEERTGFSREEVQRFLAWYTVSQLRLPPNPLRFAVDSGGSTADIATVLEAGEARFSAAGCIDCHDPGNTRTPWSDGLEHGPGAGWATEMTERYAEDPRIDLDGILLNSSVSDAEQAVHQVVDDLIPFCFDGDSCLVFGDPIAAAEDGDLEEEARRLELIARFRPTDRAEGFLPGNLVGQPRVNTPSLRGTWWSAAELAAAGTRGLREVILAPGHPALREGETGLAVSAEGDFDVHGATSTLTPTEVDALVLFVESIE